MNVKPWKDIKVKPIHKKDWVDMGTESPFNLDADIKSVLSEEDDIVSVGLQIQEDLRKGIYEGCICGNLDTVCCLKMRIPIGGQGKRNGARGFVIAVRYKDTAYLLAIRSHSRGNTKRKGKDAALTDEELKFVKEFIRELERNNKHEA